MNIFTVKLLKALGYTNVFYKDPPQSVNDYILVSLSGGLGQDTGRTHFNRPTIQIIVANKDYITAKTTADSIKSDLIRLTQQDIINELYKRYLWGDWDEWGIFIEWGSYVDPTTREEIVNPYKSAGYELISGLFDLGADGQKRYLMSINYLAYENIEEV